MNHIFNLEYTCNCPVEVTPQHFPASCQSKILFYYLAKWSNINHLWVCLHNACYHIKVLSTMVGLSFLIWLFGWLKKFLFHACWTTITVSEEYSWCLILFVTIFNSGVLFTAKGNIANTSNLHSLNFSKIWSPTESSFLVLSGECSIEE